MVWDSGTVCENMLYAFNRYVISQMNLYLLLQSSIWLHFAKLCRVNNANKAFAKVCISLEEATTTREAHGLEWEHAFRGVPVNLVQCHLRQNIFHVMLQNNISLNIGQKCQMNRVWRAHIFEIAESETKYLTPNILKFPIPTFPKFPTPIL